LGFGSQETTASDFFRGMLGRVLGVRLKSDTIQPDEIEKTASGKTGSQIVPCNLLKQDWPALMYSTSSAERIHVVFLPGHFARRNSPPWTKTEHCAGKRRLQP
jgi:hypothetical protein